jgi:hypothetical protein
MLSLLGFVFCDNLGDLREEGFDAATSETVGFPGPYNDGVLIVGGSW